MHVHTYLHLKDKDVDSCEQKLKNSSWPQPLIEK